MKNYFPPLNVFDVFKLWNGSLIFFTFQLLSGAHMKPTRFLFAQSLLSAVMELTITSTLSFFNKEKNGVRLI